MWMMSRGSLWRQAMASSAGGKVWDWAEGQARALIEVGVAFGDQRDAYAGADQFEDLVGGGGFGGYQGWRGAGVDAQPEVTQRPGGNGEGDERLVGELGEGDLRVRGETVFGREGDPPWLAHQDAGGDVVQRNRKPDEGDVTGAVRESGGGVVPADQAQ
jgi:hypothetical protein